MTSAEDVFKRGFAPVLGPAKLAALRLACVADDPRLRQGVTVFPTAGNPDNHNLAPESCCALAFTLWQAGCQTVGAVDEAFDSLITGVGVPSCEFLNWFDTTPRAEALATLAGWIDDVLNAVPAVGAA